MSITQTQRRLNELTDADITRTMAQSVEAAKRLAPPPQIAPQATPQSAPQMQFAGVNQATQTATGQGTSISDLGRRVKAQHPQYQDMSDEDVGRATLQRYPQYQDMIGAPSNAPQATIKNEERSGGLAGLAKDVYKSVVRPFATPFAGFASGVLGRDVQFPDWAGGARGSVDLDKQTRIAGGAALEAASLIPTAKVLKGVGMAAKGKTPVTQFLKSQAVPGFIAGSTGAAGFRLSEDENATAKDVIGDGLLGGSLGVAIPGVGRAFSPAARAIGRGVGRVASETLGKTTGAGADAIAQAFKNPNVIRFARVAGKNMDEIQEQILDTAQSGLNKLREQRGKNYQKALAELPMTKDIDDAVRNTRIALMEKLQDFGITFQKDTVPGVGKLNIPNFSKSTIVEGSNVLERAVDDVMKWTDTSAGGLDSLKRRLDSYISQLNAPGKKQAQSIVLGMRNNIRKSLEDNVPGYQKMTSGYREASEIIDEISKTLSLDNPKRKETALKKLMQSLRPNNEQRVKLIRELQEVTQQDILGRVAGTQLAPAMPRGIVGALGTPALGLASFLNPSQIPSILALAAMSSPRAVGEFVSILGRIPSVEFKRGFSPKSKQLLEQFLIRAGFVGAGVRDDSTR